MSHPWGDTLPAPGGLLTLRPGLHWVRMPLPFALNHINLWALDDAHEGQPSWTVVDAGVATEAIRTLWQTLWAGPLAAKPLSRMLVTHMHPDHVGNAQWLVDNFSGAQPARCLALAHPGRHPATAPALHAARRCAGAAAA